MKKFGRGFKILVVILILFCTWLFIAPFLAESLIVEKTLARADVILVLGGSATYIERTQKAAELFKQGVAPKILLTDDGERGGWNRVEKRNIPFVEMAQRSLVEQGVPLEAIEILQPQVTGTIYEVENLRKKIEDSHLKSVLLVTSAYHTRRTLWIFQKILAEKNVEIGIEHPPTGEQTPPPVLWWLKINGWELVAGEYVKTLGYWIFY